MPVHSKIDQEATSVNWADELDTLFASTHIPLSDPLPTKFHRFVHDAFSAQGHDASVPLLAWFKQVIPTEDPEGITYYALIRLQDLALEYRPSEAPLEEHIYLLLIQACAAHWESGTHDEQCQGSVLTTAKGAGASSTAGSKCDVCRLEETLAELMDKDAVLKSWAENSTETITGGNTFFEEVSEDLPKGMALFGFAGDNEVVGSSGLLSPAWG